MVGHNILGQWKKIIPLTLSTIVRHSFLLEASDTAVVQFQWGDGLRRAYRGDGSRANKISGGATFELRSPDGRRWPPRETAGLRKSKVA
jgi:hypothetical protein